MKTKSNSIFREIWKHKLCYLAILPSVAFLLFFCLYPAFTGVFRSFFRWKTKNYFSPEFCGFDNYARLFRDKTFWTSFGTLFIILAAGFIKSFAVNLPATYLIFRLKTTKAGKFFQRAFVIPMMIPGMVTVIPVFRLWAACGFYGTWWPMIIPAFLGAPFQTFLAKQFMSGLPKSYDEAARMDGASRLQVLLKVIGPMCKPLIAVIAIQSFQGAWNDYLTPLLYVISKPEKWTLSLAVGRMTSSTYGTQWNLFMAADVVYMLPILILFFFCQKYFMEGLGSLNSSGVKA